MCSELVAFSPFARAGLLHTTGATRVNRHEFALKLAEAFNLNKNSVKPAKTDEMQLKAKRPADSSLNVSKATAQLNAKPLELNQALEIMKKEMPKATPKP